MPRGYRRKLHSKTAPGTELSRDMITNSVIARVRKGSVERGTPHRTAFSRRCQVCCQRVCNRACAASLGTRTVMQTQERNQTRSGDEPTYTYTRCVSISWSLRFLAFEKKALNIGIIAIATSPCTARQPRPRAVPPNAFRIASRFRATFSMDGRDEIRHPRTSHILCCDYKCVSAG